MRDHCSDSRFVWNLALEQTNLYRPERGPGPNNAIRMRQLAEARKGSWLGEGSSAVQQGALRDFDQAMRNWWGGSHRRPSWRRMGVNEGFVIRDLTVVKVGRRRATVHVPKVGPVAFRLSRPLPENTKSARVTCDRAGRWHVSFTAVPDRIEGPSDGSAVGVDRGVANTIMLSTGEKAHAPRPDAAKRAKLQRKMARQKKGSNRRKVTKARLARLTAKEADRRKDWVEKATTDLAGRFDIVVLEDLRVRNMMRSAVGTVEEPGTRVAQKRGLNRSISEQAWGMFSQRLGDKIGDRLVLVNPAHTSTTCSACGHRDKESRESQARFLCRACGMAEHADVNAARNIVALGQRVSGRGGTGAVRPPCETSTTLEGALRVA